jgi:hypothetical protein
VTKPLDLQPVLPQQQSSTSDPAIAAARLQNENNKRVMQFAVQTQQQLAETEYWRIFMLIR